MSRLPMAKRKGEKGKERKKKREREGKGREREMRSKKGRNLEKGTWKKMGTFK